MRSFVLTLTLLAPLYAAAQEAITIAEGPVSIGAPGMEVPGADLPSLGIEVRHGEPSKLIDGVGWVLGVPNKLLLLDSRADNHDVSAETVEKTTEFLAAHEVDGVMVRVNQYDPIGEWRRLTQNDRVGVGWRATVGAVYTLGYSLIPGRLVGGDWYNPFTDTVHVYSDVPALAMEQAALAKDTHTRSHPGFYSAIRLLPLMGLVHEARAKQAVFRHVDETGATEEQAEARRVLQPQMGREVGGEMAIFVPQVSAAAALGGAAVGHVVGRFQASQIESSATVEMPADAAQPIDDGEPDPEPLEGPVFGPTWDWDPATPPRG